jgi:hypothetical protein
MDTKCDPVRSIQILSHVAVVLSAVVILVTLTTIVVLSNDIHDLKSTLAVDMREFNV